MAGTELFRIPKTIIVEHYPSEKAVIAHWESLSTPSFRGAIERGLGECGRLRAKSWIVDLSQNPGVPSQADQEWIETTAWELCRKNGVVGLINIHGTSALSTMGSRRWTKSADDRGMATYDCQTFVDALAIAVEVAGGGDSSSR